MLDLSRRKVLVGLLAAPIICAYPNLMKINPRLASYGHQATEPGDLWRVDSILARFKEASEPGPWLAQLDPVVHLSRQDPWNRHLMKHGGAFSQARQHLSMEVDCLTFFDRKMKEGDLVKVDLRTMVIEGHGHTAKGELIFAGEAYKLHNPQITGIVV